MNVVPYEKKRSVKRRRTGAAKAAGGGGKMRNVPTMRVPSSLRSLSTVYPFKRSATFQCNMNPSSGFEVSAGGGVGYAISMSFALSSFNVNCGLINQSRPLINSTEFTTLFDQWRIAKVEIKYVVSNSTSAVANTTTFLPTILVANDTNDGGLLSVSDMMQRPDHKVIQMGANGNTNNIRKFTCKPVVAMAAFQGGLTSGYAQGRPFVNSLYPDVLWFAHKLCWDNVGTANTSIGVMTFYIDVFYEFRGVK